MSGSKAALEGGKDLVVFKVDSDSSVDHALKEFGGTTSERDRSIARGKITRFARFSDRKDSASRPG